MKIINNLLFILKYVVVGIIGGFLVLFFMPNSNLSFNWQSSQEAWQFYQANKNFTPPPPQPSAATLFESLSFSNAVQRAYPSVVGIYAYRPKGIRENIQSDDEQKIFDVGVGFGSGIILDDGYIVTNYHVIANAERVSVNFYDGRRRFVNLVGVDSKSDIAILKADLKDLTPAKLANSKDVRAGDIVMAIGSPFGREQSVSMGIVSAIAHDPFTARIQTDAAINTGNSGGPLINTHGEIIGINQITFSSRGGGQTGISHAIPIDIVKNIVTDIIDNGRVRRNWIGINTRELSLRGYRQLFPGIEHGTGVIVTGIEKDSPALIAGIKPYDLIVRIDGNTVLGLSSFYQLFYNTPIGEEVELTIIRQGEEIIVPVQLVEETTELFN